MTPYAFGQEKNSIKKDSVPYVTLYDLFKKKENNLENFYINRFGKKLYHLFFEKYTEKR